MSSTNQKNALITGAAKRIGREIAMKLAKNGWNIAIHHNTSSPDEILAEIKSLGVEAISIQADLNNDAEGKKIFGEANAKLGEINLLVNNASIFEKCPYQETNNDIYERHMNINFKAPFFLSQDFAYQCSSNGQIINISDSKTTQNKSKHFIYLLSKKLLNELTDMTAIDLAPKIRVNAICVGITELSEDNQEYLEKRLPQLPLERKTKISEITEAVLYLANSDYLTGQKIYLDAGESLL